MMGAWPMFVCQECDELRAQTFGEFIRMRARDCPDCGADSAKRACWVPGSQLTAPTGNK